MRTKCIDTTCKLVLYQIYFQGLSIMLNYSILLVNYQDLTLLEQYDIDFKNILHYHDGHNVNDWQLFVSIAAVETIQTNPPWCEYICGHVELSLPCNTWLISLTLKPYSSLFSEVFGLCIVGFTAAMRARRCLPSAPLSVHFGLLSLRVRVVKFTACAWVDFYKQILLCMRVVLHSW